ncbi:RICIN domain-containing protein [Glycomyces sp. YM15]|uniref:RICIN domain-containing protein n=1 Tax=Glycomyces sp. YM15 TaxID=2800446 RepID=UPI00196654D8|nr:RICIN domain-containing protein [Glycomyces sp. YM15]
MPPNQDRLLRSLARAVVAVVCTLAVAFTTVVLSAAPAAASNTTYYVSATGSDANTGTSQEQPWRTLAKVNGTTFGPGDKILLRSGDTWTGQLWPKGSGSAGSPITIDRYGTGVKPRIAGAGLVADAVRLFNQEHWEIRNLDVSNTAPPTSTSGGHLGDFRGVGVHGDNGQTLSHFVIDSVDVHDVTGEINWIGGNSANDSPGINWGTGWDRSKNTGGIIFLTSVPDITAPGSPTVFAGIAIENSTIKNTSFAGITVKQYTGDAPGAVPTGWGTRRTAGDTRFAPHTDVVIRGNYITQKDTQFGANGVYLTNVRDGLVEDNVVDNVGVSGIETFTADRVTVQFNEIFGTERANGSADGNGMDPDIATTNQLFQYNYLHDNEDGILLCGCNSNYRFGSAIVRYNVVTGSTRWNLHFSQQSGTTAQIYNNVFHSTTAPNMVTGPVGGTATLSNNLFSSARSDVRFDQPSNLIYHNNGYSSNLTPPSAEGDGVVGDPLFVNPGVTGPYGDVNGPRLDTAENFALRAGSAFIDAGVEVAGNGARDFVGAAVPRGTATDIGAFEAAGTSVYRVSESFNGLQAGPLSSGTNGWRVTSANNAVDVVANPSSSNKSVRLARTANGGGVDGTKLARVFANPLQGIVTVEASVMRNDTEGGWFGLPYVYNADGVQAISVAFANGNIIAYQGNSSSVVGSYQSGQWYRIAITLDTEAQRYSLDVDGQRVLTDAAFRNAMPGVATIAWYANASERGSAHVDDVSVEAATPQSGQRYRIRNASTGQYLDSGADGAVALEPGSVYDDQRWILKEQQPGYWTIDNVRTGREYLDTDPNGVVIWNEGWLGDDTLWAIQAVDGGFRIDNKQSGRGYLYGSGGSVGWNAGAADANTVWTFELQ